MNGDPSFLLPILEQMHFDAVTVGNHELYRRDVIEYMTRPAGFVEVLGPRYLSSNVVHTSTHEPLGERYQILKGNHNLLVFGFLYDMTNNDAAVIVETVESTIQQRWFTDVVKDIHSYDAIAVLAHMNVRDNLVFTILSEIRKYNPHVPVQFVTGHTHRRDFEMLEENEYAVSFEAGRYLDTVGFASIRLEGETKAPPPTGPLPANTTASPTPSPDKIFAHEFLDADVEVLADVLELSPESFPTRAGQEQSELIRRTRLELGLDEKIGCTNKHYHANRSLDESDSLWGLWVDAVVPASFSGDQVLLLGNGAWREDLYKGDVLLDDAIGVSPFNNSFSIWSHSIPGKVLLELNRSLIELEDEKVKQSFKTTGDHFFLPLPAFILAFAEPFVENRNCSLIVDSFEAGLIQEQLEILMPGGAAPKPSVLADITTTSVWIDFFKENSRSCNIISDWFHRNRNGPGQSGTINPASDTFRLVFVGLAIMAVLALGTWMVYQKGVIYRGHVDAQEFATLEAMREYEADGIYNGDSYHDDVDFGFDSEGDGELL